MPWHALDRFRDPAVPKLANLRRASRAGLAVPPTVWAPAAAVESGGDPPEEFGAPWIVRSGSPTEDREDGTAAGQFLSLAVEEPRTEDFREAVRQVAGALPHDAQGRALGVVFVQPLLAPESGGVAFFDGTHYECTRAPGGNRRLTAGDERGTVTRDAVQRGEPFSDWLLRVGRVFRSELEGGAALDLEFAQDGARCTLLQARPARFPVLTDPWLSLANHREILGELPSPWIVAAVERGGREAASYFGAIDPEVRRWQEPYAVVLAGRAWIHFGFFFRLMDHWGLPRSFVTEGIGGGGAFEPGEVGDRPRWSRLLRKAPRLLHLQVRNLLTVKRSARALEELGQRIARSDSLAQLFETTAFGLGLALRTNFALAGALTGISRVRRAIGIRGRARVVTEEMMERYEALRGSSGAALEEGLDAWLARFGHRGPLESDPARPRFAEMRSLLAGDLSRGEPSDPAPSSRTSHGWLFALDRRRESFRDDLMRHWSTLRTRILEAAGRAGIDPPEDVFLLAGEDFDGAGSTPWDFAAKRAENARLKRLTLPHTARRSTIETRLAEATAGESGATDSRSFRGVALGPQAFEGCIRKADDLVELLREEERDGVGRLGPQTVLLVPALEPSWAVVFSRVGAVLTELGGELSHASILLREARKPAIVDCAGIYDALSDGDRVRLDGSRGTVERLEPA